MLFHLEELTMPIHPDGNGGYLLPNQLFNSTAMNSIKKFTVNNQTSEIPDSYFARMSVLKEVSLPDSITNIGGEAFFECAELICVTAPSALETIGDGAFENCASLTDFALPSGVETIGSRTFKNCSGIRELDLSMSDTFGSMILNGCVSIETLTIRLESVYSAEAPSYLAYFFTDCGGYYDENYCPSLKKLTVVGSNKTFGPRAFQNCPGLTEIILPETLSTISEYMLCGCASLINVTIPESLEIIERNAFSDCLSLEFIRIPATVHTVREYAFSGCAALETVIIPEDSILYSLGGFIFCDCVSLKNISFPDNTVWRIPDFTFYHCAALTDFELPDGIWELGSSSFQNSGLTNIDIPVRVTTIGNDAFKDCAALLQVRFQDQEACVLESKLDGVNAMGSDEVSMIEVINRGAFMNCTRLERIILPRNLQQIEGSAFKNCTSLNEVYILREYNYKEASWKLVCTYLSPDPEQEDDGVFYHCNPSLRIYVPKNNAGITEDNFPYTGALNGVSAYGQKGLNWGVYAAILIAIPDFTQE